MQISDMLGQYNRNIASGTEIAQGTQGIKQVVSSLQQMSVGNVFEGNVNSMENGVVILGLPDGKTIQARLDSGVSVNVGQSMFFQVKSNNGAQIAIRPFSNGFAGNPTLLAALDAASLPANPKMLTMVNAMMEESMPIDKQSLLAMARLVAGNDTMDVNTIVQMAKLGIPITEEMAAQFENYKSDQYAVLDQLESVMKGLSQQMSKGKLSADALLALNKQIAQILAGDKTEISGENPSGKPQESANPENIAVGKTGENPEGAVKLTVEQGKTEEILHMVSGEKNAGENGIKDTVGEPKKAAENQGKILISEETLNQEQVKNPAKALEGGTHLSEMLSAKQLNNLASRLLNIPEFSQNPAVFEEGKLNPNLTSKELLSLLSEAFPGKDAVSKEALSQLVSSREYRTLLRNVMEEQWLLKPQDLKGDHKVNELYQRLNRQMEQMEQVLKDFGQNARNLSDTASSIRNNIQFMNQLNQTYAYVQIPLKLSGQNAHSDLYVYRGKKKRGEEDEDLTAFLHLDLEHLGSTDIYVKMHGSSVQTDFYLADDLSFRLIGNFTEQLVERLKEKGYSCEVNVENRKLKKNTVQDFLEQEKPAGKLHRYSFDVKA